MPQHLILKNYYFLIKSCFLIFFISIGLINIPVGIPDNPPATNGDKLYVFLKYSKEEKLILQIILFVNKGYDIPL